MADLMLKLYQFRDGDRILVVPKMLRVCNSAHEPLHTPRTPKSPNAEVIRKQIVGMIHEEPGKENDKPLKNQNPLIYQIKRKGNTGTMLKPSDKNERQLERVKRSHLKFIREANSSRSKEFPSIENYVLHGESKDPSHVYNVDIEDPDKRHWSLPGDLKQETKIKNVRFHIQEEHKKSKMQDDYEPREREHAQLSCEVRGSAIQSNEKPGRMSKPSLRHRRTEAAKRQATIHTSLQLFKRRLKLNHDPTYLTPSVNTNHDNDYIIRRVPMKNSLNANVAVPRAASAPKPVIEPRLTVNTTQRPKSSFTPCLNAQKTFLKARPQSSPDRYPNEGHLLRPRLHENLHNNEMIFFQEEEEQEPETIANVVNTYFVEQGKPKPKEIYQSSLSSHNLDVHNSLTSCPDARMKHVNSNHHFDNRFMRWLEESSANSEEARRAAMRSHPEPIIQETPKSPLLPPDHNDTEL
ncbi:Hypothetical predicted protein [Mytilus galloprovincialis]|uniref:Uncharacterized protein n=2 Tax=Mytilus galloprovincialis TaxID=29158 RepID=A0A8B6F249_MYTGA|nr:Hypothetical predicted protein [Mytilus galloprovincialis]